MNFGMERRDSMLRDIADEAATADARYGPFHSTHEGLGVLIEEVAELTDAIRSNKIGSVEMEAIQVAAVALRLAESCRMALTNFCKRSGA